MNKKMYMQYQKMDESKVIFVFDEASKQSACCTISDDERRTYFDQVFDESACLMVYPTMAPCLEMVKGSGGQPRSNAPATTPIVAHK
tara:strand:+ start:500 stop:760 length:261 start_codon:yes stop_codon:yes gene_type:complete